MRILKNLTLFLIFSFLLLPHKSSAAATSPETSWRVVGQVGGMVGAVFVQGEQVYLGVDQRLLILDVTNPASPREIGATRPLAGPVEGIAVAHDLAYIANGGSGLQVVDLACPGCAVEHFYSDDIKDLLYLGTAITGADGSWSFTFPEVETGKSLHATATDPTGNTSEFSLRLVLGKTKAAIAPTPTSKEANAPPTQAPPTQTSAPPTTATSTPSGIQVCGISSGMVIAAGWMWVKRARKTFRL
jgi:hypothetical protein